MGVFDDYLSGQTGPGGRPHAPDPPIDPETGQPDVKTGVDKIAEQAPHAVSPARRRAAARRASMQTRVDRQQATADRAAYEAAEANKARIAEQVRRQTTNMYRKEQAASTRAAERRAQKEAESLAKKRTKGSDRYSLHSPIRDRTDEKKTHPLTTLGEQLKGPALAGGPVGFFAGAGQYMQYEAAGITNLAALGKHVATPAATVPGHAIDTAVAGLIGAFSGDALGPLERVVLGRQPWQSSSP